MTAPAGPAPLADLARLARRALGAERLTVTGGDGEVVLTERAAGAGRAGAAEPATGAGRAAGARPDADPGHSRCIPLRVDSGDRVGRLDLVWAGVPADGGLVDAFARHLALALRGQDVGQDGGGPPDRRPPDPAFAWADPDRLPVAIDHVTAHVTELLRPLTGATAAGITVWDPDRGILTALPGAFGATDTMLAASVAGPVTNMLSTSVRVFATGQPYLSNQASGDPGVLQSYVELFDIHRILSVALDCAGRRIGVLHLINKADEFTAADVAAAEALAPQVAAAVQLGRAVHRMADRQQVEGILAAAAVAIASGRPDRESLLPAFDGLAAVLGAQMVALVPREGAPLVRRTGPVDPGLERRTLADARTGAGTATGTATGAFPPRAGDPGWAALHVPVDLPVGSAGEVTATLSVLRRTGEPFTADERDAVTRLARLVGLAWTTERYQRQLAEIALLRERDRIADGLHDRVAQILFAAQVGIDSLLEGAIDEAGLQDRLLDIRRLLTGGESAIREVIHRISEETDHDLGRRLAGAAESVGEEFGVPVHVELVSALPEVPTLVADAAVKVAWEGLVNAAKHAGPCRVTLSAGTTGDGDLEVTVADDGLGLGARGVAAKVVPGHGLTSLRRAVAAAGGELSVARAPGGLGTRVRARFRA